MSDSAPNWRKDNVKEPYDLVPSELVWRDRQKMLERHGYLLRPRFRPDWVPSWHKDPRLKPLRCEDSIHNVPSALIDAQRMSDGKQVMLKAVERGSEEAKIASYLYSEENAKDPMNHCVPILEVLTDDSLPFKEFIVMPVLRPFDDPPFFSVDEILVFMKQVLEGLTFMHKMNVAHRDCSDNNIMFDANGMYPKGFHPSLWIADMEGKIAHPLRRSDVPSINYFFTDFGMSRRFEEGETRLIVGNGGVDRDVPELSISEPYDPFATDVFILGNVFKRNFTQKYENMKFLIPLVDAMTHQDPSRRPIAADALSQFERLTASLSGHSRRWRLKPFGNGRLVSIMYDLGSVTRECIYFIKSFLGSSESSKKSL